MAPILGENWQASLRGLKSGWDSYNGKPIADAAVQAVESFSTVPTSGGGIQIEVHRSGFDIEIEIGADGEILNALVCCEPRRR